MENFLLVVTPTGFILVTLISYSLVLAELKKALVKTDWNPERKRKVFNYTLSILIGWTIFISFLSLSGFITDFSGFPPKFIIVLIIPLVTIITIASRAINILGNLASLSR